MALFGWLEAVTCICPLDALLAEVLMPVYAPEEAW